MLQTARVSRIVLTLVFYLSIINSVNCVVLTPPEVNLAIGRKISASSTCGLLDNGLSTREFYCSLAGATAYSPVSDFYHNDDEFANQRIAQLRIGNPESRILQGGQNCHYCDSSDHSLSHPSDNMVDGGSKWWQSPPLSRGMHYNQVNITINFEQEFQIAYVWIMMANSPRPGVWVLERSTDYGSTFQPWQYFAESPAQCEEYFGPESLQPILEDDSVICSTEHSRIVPLHNGEIHVKLLKDRPNRNNFSHSGILQRFTRATNVRLRLLKTKTLQGHLMDIARKKDPTITRRYFYAIKEIFMGGRCVCNGHAKTCDILDSTRPDRLLCRCEHNTCGDQCERCCPGFEQKKFQPAREGEAFMCERCNCHGHSDQCQYDAEIDGQKLSLDINGKYEGGGRCFNCRDNTEGINCDQCRFGYFRPTRVALNQTDVCRPCQCDPYFHTGACAEETGRCFCKKRFLEPDCRECAPGYYNPPECKPCDCNINGTADTDVCLPVNDQCPCKENYAGMYCDQCAPGFHNISAGCVPCKCNDIGSLNNNCSQETGQCVCKNNFAGLECDRCGENYYNHPTCDYCDCDPSGTEPDICDKLTGQCLCKPGYVGDRCDRCNKTFYGYPHCKACDCDLSGSDSVECDDKSGQCACRTNFTERTCNKCAAGYYDYPNCLACECLPAGSKGITCTDIGTCYCKENFSGRKCERCAPDYYNFPICEACNCDPRGTPEDFAGCDKVPPGQLCTCKRFVTGRICNKCKPTFWDLQREHNTGCVDCRCSHTGSLSVLNECEQQSGQCPCKLRATGRTCNECQSGFYGLQAYNQHGCISCKCDVGGAVIDTCDAMSGNCRCKPRIAGKMCDRPQQGHYYPYLSHMKFEAENGQTADVKPVRYAIDEALFPDFSWRGYAVFSPIQDEIHIEVDIQSSSVYRVLLHYVNPTDVNIVLKVELDPYYTETQDDVVQSSDFSISPSQTPVTYPLTDSNGAIHVFVLNPGRWTLQLSTKQRLYLDYVVFIPSEYFEAGLLKEQVRDVCTAIEYDTSNGCLDMRYAPLPTEATTRPDDFVQVDAAGKRHSLPAVPVNQLPTSFGTAAYVSTNETAQILTDVTVPESEYYVIVIEYYTLLPDTQKLWVDAKSGSAMIKGSLVIQTCPFSQFCREVVVSRGRPIQVYAEGKISLNFTSVNGGSDFGLVSINAVPLNKWNVLYLLPAVHCIRKRGSCTPYEFVAAENSVVFEAEADRNVNHSTSGEKLPFAIANADNTRVMSLDKSQATVELNGTVPTPGHYIFIVHYYNSESSPADVEVLIHGEYVYNAILEADYCPNVAGCRTVLKQKSDGLNQFYLPDKFLTTFYLSEEQSGTIYIDKMIAVPFHMFSENLMNPLPVDRSTQFLTECDADNNFQSNIRNVSDFCKKQIFSLTVDFTMAAFVCDCSQEGSTSHICSQFGGQCPCKPNVIGRQCDICKSGYYGFPNCIPCDCGRTQQCDPHTGQCLCPLHVEGRNCDHCSSNAYGFDPLIGCQLCQCHPEGSEGGRLQCDPESGQCLCKRNVGARKCDQCLAGFYGFPFCYECGCQTAGAGPKICDQNTAQCICKENVIGQSCEQCKPGTFNLELSNFVGCTDCFCFETTDRCRSSLMRINQIVAVQGWTSSELAAVVETKGDRSIKMTLNEDVNNDKIYFEAPENYLGKQIGTYGGNLRYRISSEPASDTSKISLSPDVVLKGHNFTLEYWSPEQPAYPKEPFEITVQLVPEKWSHRGSGRVTRPQLMLLLNDLTHLHIKASYYVPLKSAKLEFVSLDSVAENELAADQSSAAKSVEICECPAPYTGSSCQDCADGYYRAESGSYLGACVPCQCHGHARKCDKMTGVCLQCEHNTFGANCEMCLAGFYGNPTTGTPYDCNMCPCPHPSVENNFASSCVVDIYGRAESCNCKEGYSGETCDVCDAGWYGEPTHLQTGSCDQCDCNDNNDLTTEDSCHKTTGTCYNCQNNTAGPYCERCQMWYWGDAITAKNCSECICDQCGSSQCDHETGICLCKTNVQGNACDRCMTNTWGLSRCQGCHPCSCAQASMSSQCDLETGQCFCMSGVDGQYCERCKNGYWSYGAEGCRKCDCEADLSMGTVCDVQTGQCQCQQGATGPRCDKCVENFLRIPVHGCRHCDECVHVLVEDCDWLDSGINAANEIVGNVSTAALTGARLNRLNTTAHKLQPRTDDLVRDAEHMGLSEVKNEAKQTISNAADVVIKAERSLLEANRSTDKANDLLARTEKAARESKSRAENAVMAVKKLVELSGNLGQDSSATMDRDRLIDEAQRLLNDLKNVSFAESEKTVLTELEAAKQLLEMFMDENSKQMTQRNNTDQTTERLKRFFDRAFEQKERVDDIKDNLKTTEDINRRIRANVLFSTHQNLGEDAERCKNNLNEAEELVEKTKQLLDGMEGSDEDLITGNAQLNETRTKLEEISNELGDNLHVLRSLGPEASHKAIMLKHEADSLNRMFRGSRQESHDAVAARDAYEDVAFLLEVAGEAARNASGFINAASASTTGKAKESQEMKTESMQFLREAGDAKGVVVNNITKSLKSEQATLDNIKSGLKNGKGKLGKAKEEVESMAHLSLSEKADAAKEKGRETNEKLTEIEDYVQNEVLGKLDKLKYNSNVTVDSLSTADRDLKSAWEQIEHVKDRIPEAVKNLTELQHSAGNATQVLTDVQRKLDSLRKKVALARDLANRIKVGAKFKDDSSLLLKNPPRVTRSAAYTDIQLYFRTRQDGLLFYFGNEPGTSGTRAVPTDDYLAVECIEGRAKLTIDLGDGPFVLTSPSTVSDGKWHRINIERTGKLVTMSIDSEDYPQDNVNGMVPGSKSVLNLHQDLSKFYVGGVPDSARMPRSLRARHFIGSVEDISFHGTPVGLWNFDYDGQIEIYGSSSRDSLRTQVESSGGQFTGDGYIVLNIGALVLRKESNFLLQFRTYASDALILFIWGGEKDRDFLSLELDKGHVSFQYNLGSGPANIQSKHTYNDGKWHTVRLERVERDGKLVVDEKDEAAGSAPGKMKELTTLDVYYIGGLPPELDLISVPHKPGFSGCIDKVRVDGVNVNLNVGTRLSKGIEPGCPTRQVRVVGVGLESTDEHKLEFVNTKYGSDVELTLRFRTLATTGLIFRLVNSQKTNVITLTLNEGHLILITENNGKAAEIKLELSNAADGQWHFVTASRKSLRLRLDVDDLYSKDTPLNTVGEWPEVTDGSLHFGSAPDPKWTTLIGCLADITFNGQVLDMQDANHHGVSLVGCPMEDHDSNVTPPGGTDGKRDSTQPEETTDAPQFFGDHCALGRTALGSRDDSAGQRFGLQLGSRLEFEQLPATYDKEGEFYVEFRATAINGVIFFATNREQRDYLALYLRDGKLIFSFNSGSGKAELVSKRHFMDGEWHRVIAKRASQSGWLYVDGNLEVEGRSPGGTESVETTPPFYVGGVPKELSPFAVRIMPGITRPTFGGCLRDLKLNQASFPPATVAHGVHPCSTYEEHGLYFGEKGGYAVLKHQFSVGQSFNFEMEIKPRVKKAVLLAISAGDGDFLTLQLLDGSVVFTIDSGAGVRDVLKSTNKENGLCDGHWHRIRAFKTKNVVSIALDDDSNVKILRDGKNIEINTKDSLYLGGVPDGFKTRGLETRDPYIGCIRVASIGHRARRRKSIDVTNIDIEGDVNRDNCPVN